MLAAMGTHLPDEPYFGQATQAYTVVRRGADDEVNAVSSLNANSYENGFL
jgi:hypothetical protein